MTQPRLAAFLVIRATALVLAVLVLGHFAVTHLINDVAETDSGFVLERWSSALWLAWDWTMLAAALVHAGAGIWLLIDERARAPRVRRLLQTALASTVVVVLAVGTAALALAGPPHERTDRKENGVMHKALAHRKGDDVAVAVTPIAAGEEILVLYVDDEGELRLQAQAEVPYGHKVALQPLAAGAPVTEYSTQVGVARTDIAAGDWVHVHNVKTARW